MIGCLIVNRKDNVNHLIDSIVKSHLQFYQYEQIVEVEKTLFITWNMERDVIWQLALLLELSYVKVGYGFGDSKEMAKEKGEQTYEKRMSLC